MEHTTELGDAVALTPSLFLGHDLYGIEYTLLGSHQYVGWAVDTIRNGGTVLTADPKLAMAVMVMLGIPVPEALGKIDVLGGTV